MGEEGGNKRTVRALGELEKFIETHKFMDVLKELDEVATDSNLAARLIETGGMGFETVQTLRKSCVKLEKTVNTLINTISFI